jgi:hypothetical protein
MKKNEKRTPKTLIEAIVEAIDNIARSYKSSTDKLMIIKFKNFLDENNEKSKK